MHRVNSLRTIDGRHTCNVTSFHPKNHIGETIANGRLVVEFCEDTDEHIGHPAGRIVCEPVTDGQPNPADDSGHTPETYREWDRLDAENGDYHHCSILSETVTRFGVLFWERGVVDFVQ